MKVLLSYSEAVNLVRSKFCFAADVVIEIGRKQDDKNAPKMAGVLPRTETHRIMDSGFRRLVEFVDATQPSNKIAAIREVRAVTGLGLREAKDVVENWSLAREEWIRRGKACALTFPTLP